MTLIRRFFSGPSLMQAVLAAARHHEVDPEDLAYEVIDKKHGFLKTPRGVVIEVDPEQPTAAAPPAPAPKVESEPEPEPEPEAEAGPAPQGEPEAPRQRLEEMTEPVARDDADSAPVESGMDAAAPAAPPEPPPASDPWAAEVPHQAPTADPESAPGRATAQLVDAEWPTPAPAPPARSEPEPAADDAPEATAPEAKWWDAAPAAPESHATAESVGEPLQEVAPAPPALPTAHEASPPGESAANEAAAEVAPSSPGEAPPGLDDDLRQAVAEAVDELVYLAGLRVQVASATEVDDGLAVELEGPDSRRVVAHGGRALLAIQHLLPRLLFNRFGRAAHCRLDCEGFHAARGARLERLARKAAERVRAGGRSWLLEPMAPDERRLVHLALADEPDVETESVGEGYLKRVRVAQISAPAQSP